MKLLKLIPAIFLFASCADNREDIKTDAADSSFVSDTVFTPKAGADTSYEIVESKGYYVWDVNMKKKTLKRNPVLAASTNIEVDSVINGLNSQYENILLEKISINNDTIRLKINESQYLTNQVGSSGAAQYIAQAVINLTSVPGIKYVLIAFKGGDHASPGVWSRKDFPGYIIIQ